MLLFLLLLTLPAEGKTPALQVTKAARLGQLHATCLKNSFADGKSQESVCGCLRANYEKKFSEPQLEALTRMQSGTLPKEEQVKNEEVFDFDMLASQKCLEDSAWRWVPEKSAKKAKAATKKPAPKKD